MTTRLKLYNDALLVCGERGIASLTVNEESRRLLDYVWNNGGVRAALETGQYFFAMRSVEIDYDPTVEPPFGFIRAFEKPTDWVETCALCSDPYFNVPLLQYKDEAGYWYSDLDTIYVRYVSDDEDYGGDLGKWPESFTNFAAADFASKIISKIAGASKERIATAFAIRKDRLTQAKSKSAMADPTSFPAQGSWTKARQGQARDFRLR